MMNIDFYNNYSVLYCLKNQINSVTKSKVMQKSYRTIILFFSCLTREILYYLIERVTESFEKSNTAI